MDVVEGCVRDPPPPLTKEDGLISLEMAQMSSRAVRDWRGLGRGTKKGVVLCPVSCGGDYLAGGGDQYSENMENDVTAGGAGAGGDRSGGKMNLGWPEMGWNFDHTYSMADISSSSSENESSTGCTWDSRSMEVEEEVDKEDGEQKWLTRQDVDSWNIVKKKNYIMFKAVQSPSLSSGQFWEEDFVQKVFDAVRDDLVSISGAAELLGASYSDLYYNYKKRGQVIPRSCDRRKLRLNTRMVLKPAVVDLGFDRDEELPDLCREKVNDALVSEETLDRLEVESPMKNENISSWTSAPCKLKEVMEMRAPECQSPCSLVSKESGIKVEESFKNVPGVFWDKEEDSSLIMDEDPIELKEESSDLPSLFGNADTELRKPTLYPKLDKLESERKKMNLTPEGLARWTDFILFSALVIPNVKKKFNPYKASTQDVEKFLSVYQQLHHWDWRARTDYVETLSVYLPGLCVEDLVTVVVEKVVLDSLAKTAMTAPHKVTWSKFVDFCAKYSYKAEHVVNPFLAKSELVRDFLISKLKGKELMETLRGNIFKPSLNFYTDNLTRICSELDWYLQSSNSGKPLLESKKLKCLQVAACNREAGVLTDKLALKLTPDYNFSKYSLAGVPDAFWSSQLTQDVLTDVKNGMMEREVAAQELGVTEEMVSSAIRAAEIHREDSFSLRQYVRQGFGSRDCFWKEESTVKMMLDVRNRKTSVEALATQFGVSRRRIIEKCGGVKEKEAVEQEAQRNRTTEMFGKKPVKLKSDLEKQIESAERRFDELSDYEKMRLNNMKERQKLVEMLNLSEDKAAMMTKTPGRMNRVKVKKVNLRSRERSSRLKRISETRLLRQNKENIDPDWSQGAKVRLSPRWFGQWIPQQQPLKKYFVNGNSSPPVPPVDLKMTELLDLSSKYHTGVAMVDSISSEVRNLSVEIKWEDKVSFDKFEVEHDCVISSNSLTSLDSHHDLICYGTSAGGVGVFLSGRSVTIRPHNQAVSRTVFWGGHSSLGVLSAGHDGAVRLTDLAKQMVSMEYSWDKTTSTMHKVYWMEEENHNTLLLHCGKEVNRLDMREKEALSVISLPDWSMDDMSTLGTNLSIHPMQSTMVSLSTREGVQIRDLRNPTRPAKVITPMPRRSSQAHQVRHTACGASWSPSTGQYLMVAQRNTVEYNKYSLTRSDIPTVYRKDDYSHPLLSWQEARSVSFSPMYGVNWCPWDQEEPAFLTTAKMEPVIGQLHSEPQYQVVAVGGASGQVVGKLGKALDNTCYLVHCHNTRQVVMVGNNKGDGGLAVYKANAR